jgi:hypothetical protein
VEEARTGNCGRERRVCRIVGLTTENVLLGGNLRADKNVESFATFATTVEKLANVGISNWSTWVFRCVRLTA